MTDIFNIKDFGAVGDGVTNNAAAIQAAIDAATVNGGQVVIPAGEFMSGTIVLKSNIDFHLSKGAVLICTLEEKDICSFKDLFKVEHETYRGGCFLFASHCKNVTISGPGVIYGQGDKAFYDDDTDNGFHECPLHPIAFRARTTFFEDIENLEIQDITIKNAASWTLHMAGCRHVLVNNVKILNDVRGANNDGIDPDSCKDVVISNCIVRTGDDAIVVKTTKLMSEKYGACENILINNCILASRDSGLKVGTETCGDIRNIIMSNCIMENCSRGVGIWVRDGGTIEDICIHHITGNVLRYASSTREEGPKTWWGKGEPIFIDATYRNDSRNFPGTIRNIEFDHINMKAESSIFMGGEEETHIDNIRMTDLNITMCKQGTQESGLFDELPSPRGVYEHSIPVVYARYTDNLYVRGRVRYCEPYSKVSNPHSELDCCENAVVNIEG